VQTPEIEKTTRGVGMGCRGEPGRHQEAETEGGGARPRERRPQRGGEALPPFRTWDVRRVREAMPGLSERTACLLLRVPRSSMRPEMEKRAHAVVDELLAERIRRLIELHPTYGYRLLWAMLRKDGVRVNRKAVYRILRLKRWLVHQRRLTPRPRVQGRRSQAEKSNARWAMDVTHIPWARMARATWRQLSTATTASSSASNSRSVAARRRRSGHWRRPASPGSAPSVPKAPRPSYAATMGSFSKAAAFVRPVAITACRRNSSRPTPRSRTG
jgi:hypothetical protein